MGSLGYTAADMAEQMYESLRNKLMTLPLDVQVCALCLPLFNCLFLLLLITLFVLQVFPAHGAGSPCGKNLGTALYSTIGQEIATNPALQFTEVGQGWAQ